MITFLVIVGILCYGCGMSHPARSVGDDNLVIYTTLGGPLFSIIPLPLFIPNLAIGGKYGISPTVDVHLNYSMLFNFVPKLVTMEGGISWFPIQPGIKKQMDSPLQGWSVGGHAQLTIITNFKDGFSVEPTVTFIGGYRVRWFNPYIGVNLGVLFYPEAYRTIPIHLNPLFGVECISTKRFSFNITWTIYDLLYDHHRSIVPWTYAIESSETGKRFGIVGIDFSFSWKFTGVGSRFREHQVNKKRR